MARRRLERRLLLKELGFAEEPFTISADPRFLYLSTQHGEVLERTRDVVEEFRGLAVVEGGYGVGKSSLALRLESIYRAMPDEYRVVFVHTASYESQFAGLQDLSHALGLPRRRGLTKQWREFENFLVDEHQQGRNVCIMLDDAQLLSLDALQIVHHIYNFDRGGRKLAQVVLFGQPELTYIFAHNPEIRSRVDSWFRLNPLSLEDTLQLIRFRCTVAGREEPLFNQAGFLEVFDATGGVPREIVSVCARVLDELGRLNLKTADVDAARAAIESYRSARSEATKPQPTRSASSKRPAAKARERAIER
jgi:general secretion pathway protein A